MVDQRPGTFAATFSFHTRERSVKMSKEEKDWDAEYAPEIAKRQNDVKGLLAKKDKKAALKACLVNPPVQSKNAQLKVGESGSRRNQNDRVAVLGTRRYG